MMTSPRMPSGLIKDGRGQRLWRELTEKYSFSPAELRLLETAAYTADRISKERRAIGGQLTTKGSQGQIVAHPLLPQLRADEAHLMNLLAKLDLPDDEPARNEDGDRSARMRDVAQSRWHKAYGEA
ncbi:hypothetical protein BTIS_1091 [Bifidobacterium tissieri]|uniref:Terminase n=1 Tax=Bifidobacterium tissieri TaxID=1630162 RepID=A0A261FF92_9BIFI|nr:hypothetical protein [Bifidobacterium tissieri]OZG57850.1 hypothetical protein BTIS_1091 [Bifidobacterium tissieri]